MRRTTTKISAALLATALFPASGSAGPVHTQNWNEAEARARATVKSMAADEKAILTHGILAIPVSPKAPADILPGAGYIHGIARLGIPSLRETDASLGVAWAGGFRKNNATALPSALSMASSWNPALIEAGGKMIGSEARAKGFNVMLAGGVNLVRDPRNGRNFEYFGEDPLLAGTLAGYAIRGVQSNSIISTIKHFALNGQETGRHFVDVKISDANARESDLLAFQIGIEIGNPGSVMCAYNRVNGEQACANDWLLNQVLKKDWGYKGFVMSDWGAVPSLDAAIKGLDQQSGEQLDPAVFFGGKLAAKAASDPAWAKRLDDMNVRILSAIYANGLDQNPASPGGAIDYAANAKVAEEVAKQGIVLLRNERNLLPLTKAAKSILVLGGLASTGVMSGAGSSQVAGSGGPAASIPTSGSGPVATLQSIIYHRSSPLAAIQKMAAGSNVRFRTGRSISEAAAEAKKADIVIIFANQWSAEGFDQPDLNLPEGQDALIDAVAAANPNSVVVLQTGGPVLMPWLDKTGAVLQAWYPGIKGGEAIASVLFGETNTSGKLPITFPAYEAQLPRPKLDGFDRLEPDLVGRAPKGAGPLVADYNIEGSDLGYRWNARQGHRALFPFGFGLSYTQFTSGNLKIRGLNATVNVRNIGAKAGATVVQLYMTRSPSGPQQRLAAFQRVDLKPGETQKVHLSIDPRIVAEFANEGWVIAAGTYGFALGEDAERLGSVVPVRLSTRKFAP